MNVEFYETEGINDHILGYLIKRTYHTEVITLANSFNFEIIVHTLTLETIVYIFVYAQTLKNVNCYFYSNDVVIAG